LEIARRKPLAPWIALRVTGSLRQLLLHLLCSNRSGDVWTWSSEYGRYLAGNFPQPMILQHVAILGPAGA
jgi:hypothetical protein